MDIAKARRLNSKIISVGMMGIRGMNTSSPFAQIVKIVVSIT
jgi:hypothetical protein